MKKWIGICLAIVMGATVIAGCSNKDKEETAGGASNTPQKTEFSISMRTLAFNYVEKSPDLNKDKWVKKLEEMTNTDLDIVLVPHKEFEQKMVQMFATNDIPDVVQGSGGVNGKEMAGSVEAGVFMPLDDLLQQNGQNLLKVIPKEAWGERHLSRKNLCNTGVSVQSLPPGDLDSQGPAGSNRLAGSKNGR